MILVLIIKYNEAILTLFFVYIKFHEMKLLYIYFEITEIIYFS